MEERREANSVRGQIGRSEMLPLLVRVRVRREAEGSWRPAPVLPCRNAILELLKELRCGKSTNPGMGSMGFWGYNREEAGTGKGEFGVVSLR